MWTGIHPATESSNARFAIPLAPDSMLREFKSWGAGATLKNKHPFLQSSWQSIFINIESGGRGNFLWPENGKLIGGLEGTAGPQVPYEENETGVYFCQGGPLC